MVGSNKLRTLSQETVRLFLVTKIVMLLYIHNVTAVMYVTYYKCVLN